MYSIKNIEDSEDLNELVALNKQVDDMRLQDKLDKQNFHEKIKNLQEPLIDTFKTTSEILTKTLTETYKINNKVKENLNEKGLELMVDKGMIATY